MLLAPAGGTGGGGNNRPKATMSAKFSSKRMHVRDVCMHDMKVVLGRMTPSFCSLNQLQNMKMDSHVLLIKYAAGFSRHTSISHTRALI